MNFSDLPDVPRRKIFKYMKTLNIGNKYNASLVWQEMVDDTRRSITAATELIKPFLHKNSLLLESLKEVETAGVMASTGHLDSLDELYIRNVDVSNIPVNIVNNLTKIVRGSLIFTKVIGICFSVLENIQCSELRLIDMKIPQENTKDFGVRGGVTLRNITGDISGFLDSMTCDNLKLCNIELNNSEIESLTKMLQSRVKELGFFPCRNLFLEYASIFDNYDGQGRCERMEFQGFASRMENMKINLVPWMDSKGWTMMKMNQIPIIGEAEMEIKRSATST